MCTSAFSHLIYKAVKPPARTTLKPSRSDRAGKRGAPPRWSIRLARPLQNQSPSCCDTSSTPAPSKNICKQASITADGTAQLPVSQELCGPKVLVHLRKSKTLALFPKNWRSARLWKEYRPVSPPARKRHEIRREAGTREFECYNARLLFL